MKRVDSEVVTPRFVSILNYPVFKVLSRHESNPVTDKGDPLPSLTMPDMTLSIQQYLERHAQGLSVPVSQGVYTDLDLSALDRMDRFELIDFRRRLADSIELNKRDLTRQMDEIERKKKEAEFAAAVDAKADERIKEIEIRVDRTAR